MFVKQWTRIKKKKLTDLMYANVYILLTFRTKLRATLADVSALALVFATLFAQLLACLIVFLALKGGIELMEK